MLTKDIKAIKKVVGPFAKTRLGSKVPFSKRLLNHLKRQWPLYGVLAYGIGNVVANFASQGAIYLLNTINAAVLMGPTIIIGAALFAGFQMVRLRLNKKAKRAKAENKIAKIEKKHLKKQAKLEHAQYNVLTIENNMKILKSRYKTFTPNMSGKGALINEFKKQEKLLLKYQAKMLRHTKQMSKLSEKHGVQVYKFNALDFKLNKRRLKNKPASEIIGKRDKNRLDISYTTYSAEKELEKTYNSSLKNLGDFEKLVGSSEVLDRKSRRKLYKAIENKVFAKEYIDAIDYKNQIIELNGNKGSEDLKLHFSGINPIEEDVLEGIFGNRDHRRNQEQSPTQSYDGDEQTNHSRVQDEKTRTQQAEVAQRTRSQANPNNEAFKNPNEGQQQTAQDEGMGQR